MSGSNLPAKKRSASQLDTTERVELAHEISKQYARGESFKSMSDKYLISREAVKLLLKEHAEYYRKARPDTKTLQEEQYRKFIGQMEDIIDDRGNHPALVVSSAIQTKLGAMTRLDKILGHEIQGDIEGAADGIAGLMRRAEQSGMYDRVNVDDLATIGEYEDIEEAEVIDETED